MAITEIVLPPMAHAVRPGSPATVSELWRPGVLVVDDEAAVRSVVESWLTHFKFPVWLAAGGTEAVELFRLHRARIGIVLLDVRMPDRDGPTVLADLRAIDPAVRACFMTGDSGQHSVDSLTRLGAAAVFPKPLPLGEMAEWLILLAAA